jgi:L-fuculose-phosphate aldolase
VSAGAADPALSDERARVAAVCRRLGDSGLVVAAAGNVSARRGDAVVLTPRGCRLSEARPEEMVVVDLDGGRLEGNGTASSELDMHLGIYAATGAGAVVHTHSHFATVLSCVVQALPVVHYSIAGLGGSVRVARYATFGSRELAANAVEALGGSSAVLLQNHGALTVGTTVESALERALLLEWLCSVAFHAKLYGQPSLGPTDELERVVQQSRRLNYGLTENEG